MTNPTHVVASSVPTNFSSQIEKGGDGEYGDRKEKKEKKRSVNNRRNFKNENPHAEEKISEQ